MKYFIVALFCIGISIPYAAEARHRLSGIDRSDLDSEIVEAIPIPVLFAIDYDEIYPDFADPRGGGTRTHEGEDLLAPEGTPVVSPTEAIVLSVGTGDNSGKYVYTANPGGETFRYMHLSEIAQIKRGDKLAVGDLIGLVGDTGNAAAGSYHLHFEMRDSKNIPQDPYLRLTDTFTMKEKISFLKGILNSVSDEDEYATFLVETFAAELKEALEKGYDLPPELETALADAGVYSNQKLQDQLDALVASIPALLRLELQTGSQGSAVALLQIYLIYTLEGPERDALVAAGPTGFYGPITAAAISALQKAQALTVNGVYDASTRAGLLL